MKEGKLDGIRLWVNMLAKLKVNKPKYLYIGAEKRTVHEEEERSVRVMSWKYGQAEGQMQT